MLDSTKVQNSVTNVDGVMVLVFGILSDYVLYLCQVLQKYL